MGARRWAILRVRCARLGEPPGANLSCFGARSPSRSEALTEVRLEQPELERPGRGSSRRATCRPGRCVPARRCARSSLRLRTATPPPRRRSLRPGRTCRARAARPGRCARASRSHRRARCHGDEQVGRVGQSRSGVAVRKPGRRPAALGRRESRAARDRARRARRRGAGGRCRPPLGEQVRFGQQQGEHREPLLALGAEAPEVALASQTATSCRCGPIPVKPRARSWSSRASSSSAEAGSPSYRSSAASRRKLGSRCAERRREQPDELGARSDQDAAQLGDAGSPGIERLLGRARRHSPESAVALCQRRGVVRRRRSPAREEPAQGAVEVGAANGRARLHDRQPVRREDERRKPVRSSSAALSAAPLRRARFASPLFSVTSTSTGASVLSRERDSRPVRAEADQLVARVRGESLASPDGGSRGGSSCPLRSRRPPGRGRKSSSRRAYER